MQWNTLMAEVSTKDRAKSETERKAMRGTD